jgi:hypothetical protein
MASSEGNPALVAQMIIESIESRDASLRCALEQSVNLQNAGVAYRPINMCILVIPIVQDLRLHKSTKELGPTMTVEEPLPIGTNPPFLPLVERHYLDFEWIFRGDV